ncbi:MAG: hypothetical protein ABID54_00720 [Pseudomonadota bacterium]
MTDIDPEDFEKLQGSDDPEEVMRLMDDNGLDVDDAIHVKEIMDEEGLDEEEAVELKDDL